MKKILIAILFCVALLATGGTALAQGGGAGWFDFVTDTGTLKLTGNIALGQYDSLGLISDGTNWIQLSTANN